MADSNFNWITPELLAKPGLAQTVATSANPAAASHVVSAVSKVQGTVDAVKENADMYENGSFWQDFLNTASQRFGFVTKPVMTSLEWLNKPLQEVSKDYKFIHAVYTDQGAVAGVMTTLGVALGGVAGAFVGGTAGAALGADVAATGLRQLLGRTMYQKEYKKSEDENYKISFGRDFSNVFATISDTLGADNIAKSLRQTNKGLGKTVSGLADASFDITADPLFALGRISFFLKQGKFISANKVTGAVETQTRFPITRAFPGAENFFAARSLRAITPEQVNLLRNNQSIFFGGASRQYNRALDTISNIVHKSDNEAIAIGEIVNQFPELGQAAAGRLVKNIGRTENVAQGTDAAHDVFKHLLYFGELNGTLASGALLPSRTMLSKGLKPVSEFLRDNPGKIGQVYKTFSGYMPKSLDPGSLKQSMSKFRWDAPDAAAAVYSIARYGQTHDFAVEMSGQYAAAVAAGKMGDARAILNQSIVEGAKAMGLSDDLAQKFVSDLSALDRSTSGNIYGIAANERGALGEYTTLSGNHATAALFTHQAEDTWSMPNFLEMKALLRKEGEHTNLVKQLYGRGDEFVANYYTNSIFKPLALMSAGFGMRVAAAELIPQFARYGILNVMQSKIASGAAKQSYKMQGGEADNVLSAASVALGVSQGIGKDELKRGFPAFRVAKNLQLKFASKMTTDEQIELAARLIVENNGHMVSDALLSGHGVNAHTRYGDGAVIHGVAQKQLLSRKYSPKPPFTTFASSNPDFNAVYQTNLAKASQNVAQSKISADMVEVVGGRKISAEAADAETMAMREELIKREYDRIMEAKNGFGPYLRDRKVLQRFTDQDPYELAADRVDAMMGLLVGQDGTFLADIAKMVAKNQRIGLNHVAKIDPTSLPKATYGQPFSAYVPGGNPFTAVIDLGFKKVVDPIVNNLAREPMYLIHVADEYKSMEWMISKGMVTEQQALKTAQLRATQTMLPQIHNVMLRSQFAQLSRNFFPFYFAQEQALKRTYRAMKDTSVLNPAFSSAMRFFQMTEHALSDPAIVTDDGSGNRYVNIPLVGEFGSNVQKVLTYFGIPMVGNLPISVSGNLASLQSVLPEATLPGVSPFIAVSSNVIDYFMPEFYDKTKGTALEPLGTAGVVAADLLQAASGRSANRNFWDTVIPNASLKSAFYALNFNEQETAVSNALMSAMAAAYYHDPEFPSQDSSPAERQAYIDRIKNNAKSILAMKAILGLLSPLSPKVEQTDIGFRDEFNALIKKHGNYQDAVTEFLGKHGDKAISYTVTRTEPAVHGANIQYTQEVLNWINNNKDLVHNDKTSRAALYLLPQTQAANMDWNVYAELMRQHLRSRRTPAGFMEQFYIASGWRAIETDMNMHTQNMKSFDSIPVLKERERKRWSDVLNRMAAMYPDWYQQYTSGEGRNNALVVMSQFRQIFNADMAPNDEQSRGVKDLMNNYDAYANRVRMWKQFGNAFMTQREQDSWQLFLDTAAEKNPNLAPVITAVFRKLD